MKKINLNKTSCIGCGACVAICGEHFEFDDNGLSTIIKQLDGDPSSELLEAIDSCPTNAISIVEVEDVKDNVITEIKETTNDELVDNNEDIEVNE